MTTETTESRVLREMRLVLTEIARETAVRRGDQHILSIKTIARMRDCLSLISLLMPSAGSISLAGRPHAEISNAERARQIAYFGQHDEADGRLLLRDYVGLGTLPYRASLSAADINERIVIALQRVGLVDKSVCLG